MKFLKGLFSRPNPNAFFEDFDARVNAACIEKGILKKLEDYLLVLFKAVPNKDWTYDLVVGTGKDSSWTFRIEAGWKVICKPDNFKKTVDFEVQVNPKLVLVLEFPAHGSIEAPGQFRLVLNRLIYQTRHRRSYTEVSDQTEIDSIIEYSEKDLAPIVLSDKMQQQMQHIQDKQGCEFAVPGKLLQLNALAKSEAAGVRIVNPEAVFSVFSLPDFNFEIRVFDTDGGRLNSARLDRDLSYYFDYSNAMFLWTRMAEGKGTGDACLSFPIAVEDLRSLENLFLQFFTETENKVPFETFLGANKDEWRQFYERKTSINSSDEPKEVAKYKTDDEFLKYDFESPMVDLGSSFRPKGGAEGPNRSLLQARTSGRIMAAKGNAVDVYTFDEEEQDLDFLGKFQFNDRKDAKPDKVTLLDKHNRLVWTDSAHLDSVQLSDLGKGQVVRTFTPAKGQIVQDFSMVGGKQGQEIGSDLILALGGQEIYKLDPRDPNGIVQTKGYQSKVAFDKVLAVGGEAFAVSSQDGAIRLFKDINSSAKNVIPPYMKDKVVSLDASKDGLFLLANCGRYLLLYLTRQDQTDGYSTTFKKDKKPAPRILKVHPSAVAALNLTELSFINARFDEHKSAHEKFVIAWNNNTYAVWSLTKVMRNECSTSFVKRFNERVVGADFRYDKEDIIAAFDNKLAYQKTKVKK